MTPTTLAYRDSREGARIRYAELLAHRPDVAALRGVSRVFAARTGRIWAGTAGLCGAALLAIAAAASVVMPGIDLTPILFFAWLAVFAGYVLGCMVAERRARRGAVPPATGDVLADLAQLEAARPMNPSEAHRLERASMSRLMMAIALLAPLTLHALVILLCGGHTNHVDGWIKLSLVIVGHAHLALAYRCYAFARDAVRLSSDALDRARSGAEWGAYGTAILVSAIPGGFLYLIPPILTAATGLLFNPILFRGMTGLVLDERKVLA